jgi:hypothetical protein
MKDGVHTPSGRKLKLDSQEMRDACDAEGALPNVVELGAGPAGAEVLRTKVDQIIDAVAGGWHAVGVRGVLLGILGPGHGGAEVAEDLTGFFVNGLQLGEAVQRHLASHCWCFVTCRREIAEVCLVRGESRRLIPGRGDRELGEGKIVLPVILLVVN